jgi:hypothetical protein
LEYFASLARVTVSTTPIREINEDLSDDFRGIDVIVDRFYVTVRELDTDLSAMPFEPNLRAFQSEVIGVTGADQNFGEDRSLKRDSEK